jgi:hypothetical protein
MKRTQEKEKEFKKELSYVGQALSHKHAKRKYLFPT